MMQLDFIKETDSDPKYWLVGLHSYKLDEESLKHVSTVVLLHQLIK